MLYLVPFLFGHVLPGRGVHGRAARLHPARVRVGHRPLPADGHRGDHQEGARRGGRRCSCSSSIYGGTLRLVSFVLGRRREPQQFLGALRDAHRRARRAVALEGDSGGARSALLPRSLRLPARAHELRARSEQRSRSESTEHAARRAHRRDARRRSDRALSAGSARRGADASSPWRQAGFTAASCPRSSRASTLGARLLDGQTGRHRRSAAGAAALPATRPRRWREAGLYSFVPCVSKDAHDRGARASAGVARTASRSAART